MGKSVSGFGQDYEVPISVQTAWRLLGEKLVPKIGYEIDIRVMPDRQENLRIGNFGGVLALFSLQPKSEWMRLYGIDPNKP